MFLAYFTVSTGFIYAALMTPVPSVCAEYDRMAQTLQTIKSTWNVMVCKKQSHAVYLGCCSLEIIMNTSPEISFIRVYQYTYVTTLCIVRAGNIQDCINTKHLL